MIYLLLSVLASVFLLVLFKIFPKYGVNTFSAIVFNYAAAAITGILFMDHDFQLPDVLYSNWLWLAMPLGLVFILVFFLISLTTQRMGVSTASVSNKMSVALPVLFSVIFLGQDLNALRITGICLALLAVYLTSHHSGGKTTRAGSFWLPAMVFVGSGGIDVALNAANSYYIKNGHDSALFSISIFASAFAVGLMVLVYKLLQSSKSNTENLISAKSILAGILLGIPNYFSIFFTLKALESDILNSARLFPVMNMSVVLMSAILAAVVFREKLSRTNLAGIAVAIVSILLIAL